MRTSVRFDADELGSSLEVSIGRDETEGSRDYTLEVRGRSALAVVLAGGPETNGRVPDGVQVVIRDPQDREVMKLNAKEQRVFAMPLAGEGRWSVRVIVARSEPSAEVHAAVMSHELVEKARRKPWWFSCKACKFLLEALVIALLFHIAHWAVVAHGAESIWTYLTAHHPEVAKMLAVLIPAGLLDKFLDLLKDYVQAPFEKALQAACQFLQMCQPQPASV